MVPQRDRVDDLQPELWIRFLRKGLTLPPARALLSVQRAVVPLLHAHTSHQLLALGVQTVQRIGAKE